MIAYLDTHVVAWLTQGDLNKVSRKAQRLIATADLLVSPMVTIELEFLYEIRRGKLPWRDIHAKLHPEIGFKVCNLPFANVANAALDERWTRDPFDRIIVAQAKANGFAYLISADQEIRQNYQRTVW